MGVRGIRWDRHYHVTLLSDQGVLALINELGLGEDMCWGETKTGFYTDGQWYSMSNAVEFLKFPPLGLIDKFRLGLTIFYASKLKNWRRLETIPVTTWLRRWSGKRTFEKIWLPLLKAKLGENYEEASAAFIWAIIARMYAARKSGLKKEMFGHLRGGYANLLAHFVESLRNAGVDLQPGSAVRSVTRRPGGGHTVTLADGSLRRHDRVIVTLPGPAAARICTDLSADEMNRLKSLSYQGIVCLSLLLRRPLKGALCHQHHRSGALHRDHRDERVGRPEQFSWEHPGLSPKYVSPGSFAGSSGRGDHRGVHRRSSPDDPGSHGAGRALGACFKGSPVLALSTLGYSGTLHQAKTTSEGLYLVNSALIVNGTLNANETVNLANHWAAKLLREAPVATVPGNCCVCGTTEGPVVGQGKDFEYDTTEEEFAAKRCDCGVLYLDKRPAESELGRIYPKSYHAYDFSEQSFGLVFRVRRKLEGQRLLKVLGPLPGDARILDVGCGDGFHLSLLREQGPPGWSLGGVDSDARAVAVARHHGLDVREGFLENQNFSPASCDVVLLIMTIEHLAEPAAVLRQISGLLKPGGRVVIVTDRADSLDQRIFGGRYWGGYHFPRHWSLFTAGSLATLAEQCGLEVVRSGTLLSPVNWVYSVRNWLVEKEAPAWLVRCFSLQAPVMLGVFTLVDGFLNLFGRGSILQVVLERPHENKS
ncbi:MAG: methyltransferase domain-containing protein [Verrucomicrobiales bacterium]